MICKGPPAIHAMWPVEEPLLPNAPLQQIWSAGLQAHASDEAAWFNTFTMEGTTEYWFQSNLGSALNSNILSVDCCMPAFDGSSQMTLEVLGLALATMLKHPQEKWHGELHCCCSCLGRKSS